MDASSALHPTDQTLGSYGLGRLDDRSAEAVNKHLEECPDCRQRVAETSADSFLDRVRDAQKGAGASLFGASQLVGTHGYQGSKSIAPPPADSLPPGLAEHPDYEIKRELGRGGMGVVYLAHNKLMGRDEVLKVMGRQIMERPGVLDRFLREIRAVAKLRHPNIVTAYHATRLGEGIIFAMEYVEGLDLSKLVKAKGPLPVAHAANFIYQAALGLQHAHEEELVHRDIKPHNLMLSRKGEKATVKVLDFGLAKVVREAKVDGGLTHEGQALGTPDYIAPEQILDAQSADIRADIYSLGGTLYYLLSGRPPFQAKSLYDIYQAHISRDADPLNFVRPEVPSELAALVAKMMAKDPARRFQTPLQVALALTPFFKKANSAFKSTRADVSLAGAVAAPTVAEEVAGVPRKAAGTAVAESPWQSLIEIRESEKPAVPSLDPGQRPPWQRWPIVLAGSLFGLIALGVIIITIRDKSGRETKISLPDDSSVKIEVPRENVPSKPRERARGVEGDNDGPASVAGEAGNPPVGKPPVPRAKGAWVSLFNGKDLTGWKVARPGMDDWKVANGILEGRRSGKDGVPAVLDTERQTFANFRLRITYRFPKDGRWHVSVRHSVLEDVDVSRGYTVSAEGGVVEFNHHRLGAKFPSKPLVQHVVPTEVNTWHVLVVEAVGNTISTSLNGTKVTEYRDDVNWYSAGDIRLFCNPISTIQIQQIMIEELPGT